MSAFITYKIFNLDTKQEGEYRDLDVSKVRSLQFSDDDNVNVVLAFRQNNILYTCSTYKEQKKGSHFAYFQKRFYM